MKKFNTFDRLIKSEFHFWLVMQSIRNNNLLFIAICDEWLLLVDLRLYPPPRQSFPLCGIVHAEAGFLRASEPVRKRGRDPCWAVTAVYPPCLLWDTAGLRRDLARALMRFLSHKPTLRSPRVMRGFQRRRGRYAPRRPA